MSKLYCDHFKNPLTCLVCTEEDRDEARKMAMELDNTKSAQTILNTREVATVSDPIVPVAEEIIPPVIVITDTEVVEPKEVIKAETVNSIGVSLRTISGELIQFDCPVCPDTQDLLASISRNVCSRNPSIRSIDIINPRKTLV